MAPPTLLKSEQSMFKAPDHIHQHQAPIPLPPYPAFRPQLPELLMRILKAPSPGQRLLLTVVQPSLTTKSQSTILPAATLSESLVIGPDLLVQPAPVLSLLV